MIVQYLLNSYSKLIAISILQKGNKYVAIMICNYNLKIKFVHDRVVVLKYHNGKLVNKMHIVSYEIYLFYGKLLID